MRPLVSQPTTSGGSLQLSLGWEKVCVKDTTCAQVLRIWDKNSERKHCHQMLDAQS